MDMQEREREREEKHVTQTSVPQCKVLSTPMKTTYKTSRWLFKNCLNS